jgi:hypothetical protein
VVRHRFVENERGRCYVVLQVVSGCAVSGRDAEAAVRPAPELFDELGTCFVFSFQHCPNFGAEDLLQFSEVSFWRAIQGSVRRNNPSPIQDVIEKYGGSVT